MRGLIILSLMLASSFAGAATTSAFEEAAELYRSQQFFEAKAAFTRLADQGSARASAILGMMSRFGEGGPVDLQKAYDFYLEAARAGHPPAQYQVALMLASGEGVEASDKGAAYWFTQAAENGYDKAIDRLTQPLLTEPNDGSPQVQTKPSRRWNLTLPDNFKKALAPVETRPQRLGIKVQLGAMATKDAAIDLWQLIRDELPEIDQDLPVTVSRHSESGQAEIYRLRVGDFGSVVQARGFCRSIENLSRRPCWVVADHAQ